MNEFPGIQRQDRGEGVVELSLAFNEKNAFDEGAFLSFSKSLMDLGQDGDLRVLILSSGNPDYFSNGLDPAMFINRDFQYIQRAVDMTMQGILELLRFNRPVVCAINGHCMGAGAILGLFSDYRLMASRKGRIGFPEIRIGLSFPSGVAAMLADLVGPTVARDLLFDGSTLKAEQALACGLIDEVHPAGELAKAAMRLALSLAKKPPMALKATKLGLKEKALSYMVAREQEDRDWLVRTIHSTHGQEGFLAVLEDRRPSFE